MKIMIQSEEPPTFVKLKIYSYCLLLTYSVLSGCSQEHEENKVPVDGPHIEYYDSGQISTVRVYKDGRKHGRATWYYESGELMADISFFNGVPVGEAKRYYPDGQLKEYQFTDSLGNLLFFRELGEKGNIVNEQGYPLYIIPYLSGLKEEKPYFITKVIIPSSLPGTKLSMKLGLHGKENVDSWQDVDFGEKDEYLFKVYLENYECRFSIAYELTDTFNMAVYRDTILFNCPSAARSMQE